MARLVCLAAGCMLDADPFEVAEAAALAGFDGIGLRLSGEHRLDEAGLVRLRRRVDDLGIVVLDIEVHRITAEWSLPAWLIDAAAIVGARSLLVVSDDTDVGATIDRLGQVSDAARAVGVTVGMEYMAWTTPSTPAGAIEMATATGVSIVVDVLHHTRVGAGVADLDAVVASGRLGWVQLCDAVSPVSPVALGSRASEVSRDSPVALDDLIGEARHRRLPPGEGALPLRALLAVVPQGTPLSVEVQSDLLARSHGSGERARVLYRAAASVLR